MFEFAAFFVMPFDENVPTGADYDAIDKAREEKDIFERECLEAYRAIIPEERKRNHKVWAQSRIDMELRIIGVSLRLPIEKGADKNVVPVVRHDDFLYWDPDELLNAMKAMNEAVSSVAEKHGAVPHVAFSDVKYHF